MVLILYLNTLKCIAYSNINNIVGGFMTKLMHKDLGLASGVASATLTPIPLGTLAHQLFTTVIAHGLGDKDFSVIYDFIQEQGKKK